MSKLKILTLLVLLMTAVTGAWATITVTINQSDWGENYSFTIDGVTVSAAYIDRDEGDIKGGGTFSTTLGNFTKIVVTADWCQASGEGWSGGESPSMTWAGTPASTVSFGGDFDGMGETQTTIVCTIEPITNVTGVTLAPTSATLTLGETETVTLSATVLPDGATDKSVTWTSSDEAVATVADGVVTAVAAGTATITVTTTDGAKTATCTVTVQAPAPAGYTVSMPQDTPDAGKWTARAGTDGTYQQLPLEGVAQGAQVSLKYDGALKVKSVRAKKKAAPAPTGTTLTLGAMSNGGDPFSGSSGSGAYSQTFAVGGQIAIIYKNTSNESVKVVTDALTAADISNEGKTATINVSIDDADKTQGVTYIYPAAMANYDGTINYDFKNQDGTVTAIYKGSGDWDGDALSSATMESQQAIVKFILKDNSDNLLDASSLNISAASNKLVASKGFFSKSTTHSGYTYDGGTTSSYESPSNLVDGKKNYPYPNQYTKWCTNTSDKVDGIWYCEFHTESAVQVNGYTITTGHDNSSQGNRNPKDWVLKAKADAGDSWTTIATVTNDATLEDDNVLPFDFNVDVHGTYQYFRFEVSATRGSDVMQIEELELFESNYGTAYGDLTVTPASATSEIFVALLNENDRPDTYTLSANVGEKKYAFSKSDVIFQNGKYYEITVKMTEQTASTVTWEGSTLNDVFVRSGMAFTAGDITLSVGSSSQNKAVGTPNYIAFTCNDARGFTFTAPSGKKFTKIEMTPYDQNSTLSFWNKANDPGIGTGWSSAEEIDQTGKVTWKGEASSVDMLNDVDSGQFKVSKIVFTLE